MFTVGYWKWTIEIVDLPIIKDGYVKIAIENGP